MNNNMNRSQQDSFMSNSGQQHNVGNPMGQNQKPKNPQSKEDVQVKSGLSSFMDDAKNFFKQAFLATPYESIFELALLIAGATRTLDLMHNMGQSGWGAVAGLVYAELGIILYEFLEYKGRRVRYKKQDNKTGKVYETYPMWNQKSIAKLGLWLIHLPLTVFFTTSDMVMTNLKAMSGMQNFDSVFAWILGIVIGTGFFADLILVINYKGTDPERRHAEEMSQLEYDAKMFELEKEKLMVEERLAYARKNAKPLAGLQAKLETRSGIIKEYGGKLGEDYVKAALEEIDEDGAFSLGVKKPQQNQSRPQMPNNNQPQIQQNQRQIPRPQPQQGNDGNKMSEMNNLGGSSENENFTKPLR